MENIFEAIHLIVGLIIWASFIYFGFKSANFGMFLGMTTIGGLIAIFWPAVLIVALILAAVYFVGSWAANTFWAR